MTPTNDFAANLIPFFYKVGKPGSADAARRGSRSDLGDKGVAAKR